MSKQLLQARRGATLAELGTMMSLLMTLAVVGSVGFSRRDVVAKNGLLDSVLLEDQIKLSCLTRSIKADLIPQKTLDAHNCFSLGSGNDRFRTARGGIVIFPGAGDDVVHIGAPGATNQITYAGGSDTYHVEAGRLHLDLSRYPRSHIRFSVTKSVVSGQPVDLAIDTPEGRISLPDYFPQGPIQLLQLSDRRMTAGDIALSAISDAQSAQADHIIGTEGDDMIEPGGGDDLVEAGPGDDVVIYVSGQDRYDAGTGADVLQLPDDVSITAFSVSPDGKDVILSLSGGGRIILLGQAMYPPTTPESRFAQIRHGSAVIDDRQVLQRAIRDQGTSGADTIHGTRFSDIIRPGSGDDLIHPGGGDDVIFHTGGHDRIMRSQGITMKGSMLDLSPHGFQTAEVSLIGEADVLISLPDGSSITIEGMIDQAPESGKSTIENFRFSDRTLSAEDIWQIALPRMPATALDSP